MVGGMSKTLRAVVLGAGYAGQGHALALASAEVEVAGISSRNKSFGRRVAREYEIPNYSTDWRKLIDDLRPDLVAVGTPGGTHVEMITAALEAGCHVFTDKPLATTAADAKRLYELARTKPVKTAYAASYWYQTQALHAAEIVRSGELGPLYEIEFVSHFNWPKLMPFGWPHRLETGGGRLNNVLPHQLAISQRVTGGELLAIAGETRNDLKRAPLAGQIHDFREYSRKALSPEQAAQLQWADVDSDWSFTALARFGDPARDLNEAVSVTYRHSALRRGRHGDYVALYGELGTLHVEGAYMQGPMFLKVIGTPTWEELAAPLHIVEQLPDETDNTQRNWDQAVRDFVADIRGEPCTRYLTFREGWLYQEAIDRIRQGLGRSPN